jgi:Ni/Co efflux regulator RcnB
MKRSLMAGMALAFMVTGPLAYAQPDTHDQGQHPAHEQAHAAPAHSAPGQNHPEGHVAQEPNRPEGHMAPAHQMAPQHEAQSWGQHPQPAYQGQHQWHNGDRYNGSRHQVDWRSHHLRQPPSGYEWVQNGNDYVLIAISSGIVAGIIANALSH